MRLHRLVVTSAARDPDALAVAGPCGRLTYRELDRWANSLAHRLAGRGVGYGDRVIIWSGKSVEAIVAMQAVLRLGAAYVPVSGGTPARRVAALARDCTARAICVAAEVRPQNSASPVAYIPAVDIDEPPPHEPVRRARIDESVAPDDLAFILYTSGSTGAPKGVCITHRNALAFIDWAVHELDVTVSDRFANHAPLTFDLSVMDLYAAFACGATVCPVPDDLAYAPRRLVEFLKRESISIWYSVPSVLTLMMREGGLLDEPAPVALRALLFAGEPFPIRDVRQLADWYRGRLLNLYGPTETNVCTYHEVVPADLERDVPVPIGKACSGNMVWAVKPDGMVAGPGDVGELMVEGPTVARGYWGHPPHIGPYATGDAVRVLADGVYDYAGRIDDRLKIRGHRIEPGETEAALHTHPEVAETIVVGRGEGLDARLVAFVVRRPGSHAGVLAVKRHVAERLPIHMIPDDVYFVDNLPRTPRGKLDRTAMADVLATPRSEEGEKA